MDLTRNSLKNIYDTAKGITYEIICIDNNSSDGTVEMIKSEFPEVRLIENKVNKGFSFANNQGFKISRGRYIALYNPDTLAVGNAFGEMVRYMDENPEIAALGPQLLNEDGSVQISARNGYINLWNEFCIQSGLYRYLSGINLFSGYQRGIKDVDKIQEVDQVITACMIVRREAMEEIDGMDEKFFLYGDDVDFNKRLKDKHFKIVYYPRQKIYHLKGKSSSQVFLQAQTWSLNGICYFFQKHQGV